MCLGQGKDFKKFVERAKASGENDQRFGQIGKPLLAHEEIVELKIEFRSDVLIWILLKRQPDIQADRFSAGFMGAAIGRLHNPGAATGRHHKTMALTRQSTRPVGKHVRQPARVFVIAGHLHAGMGAFKGCLQRVRILAARLRFGRRWFGGAGFFQDGERILRVRQAGKAGRAKKDDRILYLLAPKTGKRLRVFRKNAQNPSVRAVEKIRIQA